MNNLEKRIEKIEKREKPDRGEVVIAASIAKGERFEWLISKCTELGVDRIDIFTVFNPFPGVPDLKKIIDELGKDSVLLGCVDWNRKLYEETLVKNGFKAVVWEENDYQIDKEWFNCYNPFVFAVLKK